MAELDFKSRVSIEERSKKSNHLLYLNCIPIILQPDPKSKLKRLQSEIIGVQPDYQINQIKNHLKQQLKIAATQGVFLYSDKKLLNDDMQLLEIYSKCKDPQDKLLYLTYALQQAFG